MSILSGIENQFNAYTIVVFAMNLKKIYRCYDIFLNYCNYLIMTHWYCQILKIPVVLGYDFDAIKILKKAEFLQYVF